MLRTKGESFRGLLQLVDGRWRPEYVTDGPGEDIELIKKNVAHAFQRALSEDGGYLLWEKLEVADRRLVRSRTAISDRVSFVQSRSGVIFEVEEESIENGTETAGRRASPHPWTPLMPQDPIPLEAEARIGWSAEKPVFGWRYCQPPGVSEPVIEVIWRLGDLPATWAEESFGALKEVACTVDGRKCSLKRQKAKQTILLRGRVPLEPGERLKPQIRFSLEAPLAVVENEERYGDVEGLQVATVEAADFVAVFDRRETRLVTIEDLGRPFRANVLVELDTLLPETVPAGTVQDLPWDLEVVPEGEVQRQLEPPSAERGGPEKWRRWQLRPRSEGEQPAVWREVFSGPPPSSVAFGMGAFELKKAPEIHHIVNRVATVTWRIGTNNHQDEPDGGNGGHSPLCFCIPQWLPVGYPDHGSLPIQVDGFEYQPEVRATFRGIEEHFLLGSGSELPSRRLLLDPDRWRCRDDAGNNRPKAIVLGAAEGYVRWRRAPGNPPRPADWASRNASVLVVGGTGDKIDHWGGLYVPGSERSAGVPWDDLEEVRPTWNGRDRRYRLAIAPTVTTVWLALWGFLSRFDRVPLKLLTMSQHQKTLDGWISDAGLPLFPRPSDLLLRSFAPTYCVRSRDEDRLLSFSFDRPRPTLRIGEKLFAEEGLRSFQLGESTRLGAQMVDPGELPGDFVQSGGPGRRFTMKGTLGQRVLWLLLEDLSLEPANKGTANRRSHRLVLSWDAQRGWCFRGFYAEPPAQVDLGTVLAPEVGGVDAGGEPAVDVPSSTPAIATSEVPVVIDGGLGRLRFHLVIEGGKAIWSPETPQDVGQLPDAEIIAWAEERDFGAAGRPAALADFDYDQPVPHGAGAVRIDFRQRPPADTVERVLAIRLWQPRTGITGDDLRGRQWLAAHKQESEPTDASPGAAARPPESTADTTHRTASGIKQMKLRGDEDGTNDSGARPKQLSRGRREF